MRDDSQTFYQWTDAQGRVHVVSSFAQVPAADRAKAQRVNLNSATSLPGEYHVPAAAAVESWKPDLPSFGVGFGAALVLALLFRFLPSAGRGLTRVVVVLGIAALLGGLYLGAIRRATGAKGAGVLASPSALIDDAKAAVEQLNTRQKQQEEELRKIQAEGR